MLRPRADPERSSGRPTPGVAAIAIAIAVVGLPWTWFLIRDASPVLDWIAFALPAGALALAIGALAIAAVAGRRLAAAAAFSLLVFVVIATAEPRTPERLGAPDRPFRLVAANVFDENTRPRDAARSILDAHPEVVVAVEMPEATAAALSARLPNSHNEGRGVLGVYSSWPVQALGPVDGVPVAAAMRVEIERPGSPFLLYAIHLPNPLHQVSFEEQLGYIEHLIASAEREALPVVLAGDFNVGDRSQGYRRLHDAFRDAMLTTWGSTTYHEGAWLLLQLRIDHVFLTDSLCASGSKVMPLPGSDHDALRVQIGACR